MQHATYVIRYREAGVHAAAEPAGGGFLSPLCDDERVRLHNRVIEEISDLTTETALTVKCKGCLSLLAAAERAS
jgi:hypothetical protein